MNQRLELAQAAREMACMAWGHDWLPYRSMRQCRCLRCGLWTWWTTPEQEREYVIGAVIGSQRLSGIEVSREVAERSYDKVAAEPPLRVVHLP